MRGCKFTKDESLNCKLQIKIRRLADKMRPPRMQQPTAVEPSQPTVLSVGAATGQSLQMKPGVKSKLDPLDYSLISDAFVTWLCINQINADSQMNKRIEFAPILPKF
jgi:hypothetical protein